jgi:hypothetical protein
MIMKKFMVLIVCMMASTIIFAQRHGSDKDKGGKHAEKMKTMLSLNDDQVARIKVIDEKFKASHVKLKSDTALTVGTMHNKMQKLKTEREAELKGVLTETQWTKWTTEKEKRGGHRKGHHHGRGDKGDKG